jgi:cytochrome c
MDLQDRKFLQTFSIFVLALLVIAVVLLFLANGLAVQSRDEKFGGSRLAERQAYARLRPVGQVSLASKVSPTAVAATPVTTAGQGPALKTPVEIRHFMTAQGCFACHAIDSKVVGPAYAWVAYRFRGLVAAATVKLAHKIIAGGVGYWSPWTGGIAMPAHPQLTLAQAEAMARWVLSQHPLAPPQP